MFSSKRLVALAAVVAIALAACGDDDDSTSATTAAAPATTQTTGGTGAPGTTAGSTGTTSAPPDYSKISGTLVGVGSSAQQAAMQAWQAGFQALATDSTVEYDPSGSGAGRDAFLAGGNTDFAGSDSYLSADELTASNDRCAGGKGAIDLPHYISPIAVAYNVPALEGTQLQLSAETIAKIFTNQITNWNDAAIAADNPGVDLPDLALNPVHRSDKSGTTANFTDYLSKTAADTWTFGSIQDWDADGPGGGEGADKTSGVIASIGAGEGSIGYADESQLGDLPAAKIGVGSEFVAPSAAGAAKAVDLSSVAPSRPQGDFAIDIKRDTDDPTAYPLVLVSYHIVCLHYDDPAKADFVKAFMTYVGSEQGQKAAADAAGSAPISDTLRQQLLAVVNTISAG